MTLRVEITDHRSDRLPEREEAGCDAMSGRGLLLVAGLATRWGWDDEQPYGKDGLGRAEHRRPHALSREHHTRRGTDASPRDVADPSRRRLSSWNATGSVSGSTACTSSTVVWHIRHAQRRELASGARSRAVARGLCRLLDPAVTRSRLADEDHFGKIIISYTRPGDTCQTVSGRSLWGFSPSGGICGNGMCCDGWMTSTSG